MNYKTPPMKHQADEMEHWRVPHRAIFWDMGVGKTWLAINTIAKLFANRKISGALIFAPKSMMHQWIEGEDSEWAKHSPVPPHMVAGYTWSASKTKKNLEDQENVIFEQDRILDVVVVNTEAVFTKTCFRFVSAFLRNHKRVLTCIDEAHMIKNYRAKRSKVMQKIGKVSAYRRVLTGTPITNSPMDMFGVFRFVHPEILGYEFSAFRAKYAKIEQSYGKGGKMFPKVLGYQNLGELRRTIAPHSSRMLKSDVLDLPPLTFQTLYCDLGKEQSKIYMRMLEEAIVEIQDELDEKSTISAPSVLARLTRLKQIACGFLPDPDTGKIIDIKDHERYDVLMEFLGYTDHKVILWFDFVHNVEKMAERIDAEFGKNSYVKYIGATKDKQATLAQFKKEEDRRFFLATTKTGQLGLNLTEAVTMVFYSQSYNLGDRLQAQDRFYRKGQEKPVTIYDMLSPGTIDIDIRERLIHKKGLADLITDGRVIEWLKELQEKAHG